ncbi:hypothetical protein [Lachnospira multipara]|uniref:hypothetical protein n=1 Tax=Lachnospira multipara TaxID=28051 RepID=UPI00069055BD|nr:hypothetical protein [Lachnospira multipara]
MIISSSNIAMKSDRSYKSSSSYKKEINTQITGAKSSSLFKEVYENINNYASVESYSGNGFETLNYNKKAMLENINDESKKEQKLINNTNDKLSKNTNTLEKTNTTKTPYSYANLQQKIYSQIVSYLHQFMLISLFYRDYGSDKGVTSFVNNNTNNTNDNTLIMTNSEDFQTWTITSQTTYTSLETENVSMSTTGNVVTSDGNEISFNLDLTLSREFIKVNEISNITTFDKVLTDPLVINLDDCPVSLTNQHFYFDLDSDGVLEEHAKPASNTAFLAIDLNDDGVINDGGELFGTKSGDGFNDLSIYDSDNDGWIDEADNVYSKLKVWVIDEDGQSRLLSLKEADVGAIYLGKTKTDFDFTNDTGEKNAHMRSSGVFLHEDGRAGLISQIDI